MAKPNNVFLALLLIILPSAHAATIAVGGDSGWTLEFNYNYWANNQTFKIGDVLVFNFGLAHSVIEVQELDYIGCNTDEPIGSYDADPTLITLSASGTRYFICPEANHCDSGMRMTVTVAEDNSTDLLPPPPPETAPFTPNFSAPVPRRSPPPRPSEASKVLLRGQNCLLSGVSLVLAILIGVLLG